MNWASLNLFSPSPFVKQWNRSYLTPNSKQDRTNQMKSIHQIVISLSLASKLFNLLVTFELICNAYSHNIVTPSVKCFFLALTTSTFLRGAWGAGSIVWVETENLIMVVAIQWTIKWRSHTNFSLVMPLSEWVAICPSLFSHGTPGMPIEYHCYIFLRACCLTLDVWWMRAVFWVPPAIALIWSKPV